MDYRVDFLGEETVSAAWFQAADDGAAFTRALVLFQARVAATGFTLWERNRLVHAGPGSTSDP